MKDVVVYKTMSEEKAEEFASRVGGQVRRSTQGYVCESCFVSSLYEVVVKKEEKES